jgi:intergrase/recombinase
VAEKFTVEELADNMYKLVEEYAGTRKLKAQDLVKEMQRKYGEDRVSKDDGKKAIRLLIDSGRCVYTYFGGSFVELPPKE